MSLYRSRFLMAAASVAALGTFGALPALAAGMASSSGSMMSAHGSMSSDRMSSDRMSSDSMSSQPVTQNPATGMQHRKPAQTANTSGMKAKGSMQ